jgi:hypothetical protein
MTLDEFTATLSQSTPPNVSPLLRAMWHDAKGDWEGAHNIAQDIHSNDGSWIHAYLHRKEGDDSNAAYWYRRANKPVYRNTLEDEWKQIVSALL